MKEFKGTKGGWEYIPPFSDISTSIEVSGIRQGQERIIASIPIHDKWERENDDPNGWKKATYPEQIANAKLIAAAPDLLEALQVLNQAAYDGKGLIQARRKAQKPSTKH